MAKQKSENRNNGILLVNAPGREGVNKQDEQLRKRAEARLNLSNTDISQLSAQDIQKLLYEFQVHQIELELQNEEIKRAYEELSLSRERYARLYNSGTVGYLSLNEEGVIEHANLAAAKLLHCPLEMLTMKKFGEFIHADDQDAFYFFIHDLVVNCTDKTLTVRLKRQRETGSDLQCPGFKLTNCTQQYCIVNDRFIYVECRNAINFCDSNDHHICLSLNDVSERRFADISIACLNVKLEEKIAEQNKELVESNLNLQNKVEELHRSEHQLLEREAKLNAIFNAAIEGIITIDRSGIIVSVNTAIETIFGYSQQELIGCNIVKLIPVEEKIKRSTFLQTRIPEYIDRIRTIDGKRKDGSLVPLDISMAQFSIDGVNYYTSIVRDVSLRKLKEQEDKAHLDSLAHVTRLGLMGEMASGIAHEVNQPLAAIAGYSQACLNFMEAEKPDLPQLREILQKTYQQALKAGQIIHRMREFVTFKTIHRSSVEINELVNVCMDLCAADLKYNNIFQRLNLAKNIPVTYVDSVQIEQVLLNLIRNSLDALKNLPENTQRLLSIETSLDDHQCIVIRVKDNGRGISKTQQGKILTPFFTTKESGMGMGLSISQSLVKANGGVLFFNSKPGKGTTFYFTLPIQEQ